MASSTFTEFTADSISASGQDSEKLSLTSLQSKIKADPEGYSSEMKLIYSQFLSSLELFQQQAALNFTSLSGIPADMTISKDLADRAMFLAHVTPFYRKELANFPIELLRFLETSARNIPSGLRLHVTQSLILMINRKIIDMSDALPVFMELQTLGDRQLRKLACSHVIHWIRRMNQKHKNDPRNKALQKILFGMLEQDDEARAKRALITVCDLHKRKVWSDDRTANAICMASFHASPRIMKAVLSFLLDLEKIEDDEDTDDSGSEDDPVAPKSQVVLNKEAIYKASHTGTTSSKKKKKAKLQRVIRSMKKQQRVSSAKNDSNYYSPLNNLKDAQGFAEKLFSRLQSCNERFEVKMMMLKVIARTIGLHRLILLNIYPYFQRYVQPHQWDVINLLAAAVQACHDMVPPDVVEPLFKQIVNQFVHDRSRPEAISVGLNVVREICLRMPLLMTEDLLQDLVLYRKSHEKAVSSAARSLLTLFREVCPSLLVKKDRGRPSDPKARPKAYGEVHVAANVSGVDLLEQNDDDDDDQDELKCDSFDDEDNTQSNEESEIKSDGETIDDQDEGDSDGNEQNPQSNEEPESKSEMSNNSDCETIDGSEEDEICASDAISDDEGEDNDDVDENKLCGSESDTSEGNDVVEGNAGIDHRKSSCIRKRKLPDFEEQLNAAQNSLRALKRLAKTTDNVAANTDDGILSNEDFQRIKELKAKHDARALLTQHGFKIPNSEQLSAKRVDATKLEANIKRKLTKDEKLAMIRAGREERGKYQSRTAIKQKKTGGLSNRQKEHKKAMPLAAKRSKMAKSRQEKKKLKQRSGKQFRGKKAWK